MSLHERGHSGAIPASILAALGLADPVTLKGGSDLDTTTEHLGRYPVLSTLGSGGMGSVMLVRDRELGRDIAAKVMHREEGSDRRQVERFVLESRVAGQLEHPNIVPVYELGRTPGGRLFFTMRHVAGKSLGMWLNELLAETVGVADASPLLNDALPELLEIYSNVCHAIEYAHSRGVVHRDLKPHNVMLGRYGEVQLMDWGLARILGEDAEESVTATVRELWAEEEAAGMKTPAEGLIVGTLTYMPPEQARGEDEDRRVDIYALGAMLYHILTFRPPFEGNAASVLDQLMTGKLVKPTERAPALGIPWELEAVALKAMASDRNERYNGAGELLADIRRYQKGHRLKAASYTRTQSLRMWIARHAGAFGAGATVIIIGLVLATIRITTMHRELTEQRAGWRGEVEARITAEERLTETRRDLARSLVRRAAAALKAGRRGEARVLLAAARMHAREMVGESHLGLERPLKSLPEEEADAGVRLEQLLALPE